MPCRRIKIETVEGAVAPDLAKGDLIIAKYFDGTDYRTARAEVLTVGDDYVDIMPRIDSFCSTGTSGSAISLRPIG